MASDARISPVNQHAVRTDGDYVLYWMIAARRTSWNFALDRACAHAEALDKPLVIFEPLRVDYPWASERLHQFAIDGMRDNRRACESRGVLYFPYVEPTPGDAKGLLAALASRAAVVVTDESPGFFLTRMVAAAGARLPVRLEAVDSNGLLPMRALTSPCVTAYVFRRALQRLLPAHLADRPARDPLRRAWPSPPRLAADLLTRWPASTILLEPGQVSTLPIDHGVAAVAIPGGEDAARSRLRQFLDTDFDAYGVEKNHPDREISSRLSPYLHWGQLSVHEVFDAITKREGWLGALPAKATGAREGWWGLSPSAEAFLDELVVWRELGLNVASTLAGYDRYESLPAWAQKTLERHADDEREYLYTADAFEAGATHDPLWNAAQQQLRTEGRLHNYLRMLWGKKILEWSATPREALRIMIELNNKYALDGRDANSTGGIFWILGRHDRPWLPERPVLGAVRYMSSSQTARKFRVREYVRRYSETA